VENKVIEILIEAISNRYFMYAVIAVAVLTVLKSLRDYRLYKMDCIILNQKPKPIGFMQNTIISILMLSTIVGFAFTGYTAYNHQELFSNEKSYTVEKSYTPREPARTITNYKIDKIVMHQKPVAGHVEKKSIVIRPRPAKPAVRKMTAKEKLKQELEQAINAVDQTGE